MVNLELEKLANEYGVGMSCVTATAWAVAKVPGFAELFAKLVQQEKMTEDDDE